MSWKMLHLFMVPLILLLVSCYYTDGKPMLNSDRVRDPTDEERLKEMLFRHYNESYRPVYNASEPVELIFGINLITISKMDEIGQVLELSVWLELFWRDQRLTWNPSDFSYLNMIRLPTKHLWTPDIVLYNSADDFRISGEVRGMIDYNGTVFVGPYVKVRSTCILDLTLYPFDDQLCRLIFGSWSYDMSQLVVISKDPKPILTQYVESAVWDLLDSKIQEKRHFHSCCPYPFSDIVVSIRMRRRFLLNNLFNVFIPTLWLTVLTLLTFWLDPSSGEKISLGITLLVTFTLFQLLVAENTPRTSDFIPLISLYLVTSYLTTSIVVGLQVFILNLHGLSPVLVAVPHWLRILVLNGIGRCLCLNVEIAGRSKLKGSKKKHRRVPSKRKAPPEKGSGPIFHTEPPHYSRVPRLPNTIIYEGSDDEEAENEFHERELNVPITQQPPQEGIDATSDDTSVVRFKAKQSANEHIYMGIEGILEVLQPKPPQRFLQRDTNSSFQSLRPARGRPKRLLRGLKMLAEVEAGYIRQKEVWHPMAPRTSNVTFSVQAPPPSPVFEKKSEYDLPAYQRLEDTVANSSPILAQKQMSNNTFDASILSLRRAGRAGRWVSESSWSTGNKRSGSSRFEEELIRSLVRSVGFMVRREQSSQMTDLVVAEWRMIAYVLDRLAFWLFAVFTITFILTFLILLPQSAHFRHRHNGTMLIPEEVVEVITTKEIESHNQ